MVNLNVTGSHQSIWKLIASVNHKKLGDSIRLNDNLLLVNDYNGL